VIYSKHLTFAVDPDSDGSALILVGWIRIQVAKVRRASHKSEEMYCFKVLDVFF
jgi:hypothetical protein